MGVNNLWKLLEPCGRRVAIESLAYKVLAVDASIWLVQFVKAMRDDEGKMIANAHIIGTFRRVVQLLMNRIVPIFVFDGATPALKLRTIRQRQSRRLKHETVRHSQHRKKTLLKHLQKQLDKQNKATAESNDAPANASYAAGFNPGDDEDDNDDADEQQQQSKQPPAATAAAAGESAATAQGSNANAIDLSVTGEGQRAVEGAAGAGTAPPFSTAVDDVDDDDVEWESGGGDGEEAYDDGMVVPETAEDMDEDALLALPTDMQKDVIEQLKRKQRTQNRQQFLPLAGNPLTYSQLQISTFLKSSALNRKLSSIQEKMGNAASDDGGTRIAGDAGRKFILSTGDGAAASGAASSAGAGPTVGAGTAGRSGRGGSRSTLVLVLLSILLPVVSWKPLAVAIVFVVTTVAVGRLKARCKRSTLTPVLSPTPLLLLRRRHRLRRRQRCCLPLPPLSLSLHLLRHCCHPPSHLGKRRS